MTTYSKKYFLKRGMKVYYNELKAGEDYTNAKRTIAINILDYEIFEEGPYHEIATLRREYKNTVLTDRIEFHFIQIPKFLKEKNLKGTKLEQWLNYISQKNEEVVRMAIEKNEEIKKANDDYEYLTGEEAERRLAFLREKAIRDEINNLNGSRQEGIEIGMKKGQELGKKAEKIEIAKKMIKKGMDIKVISELTNLSEEEIEKIK